VRQTLAQSSSPRRRLLPSITTTLIPETTTFLQQTTPLHHLTLNLLIQRRLLALFIPLQYQQHLPQETQEHSSLCQSKISRPSVSSPLLPPRRVVSQSGGIEARFPYRVCFSGGRWQLSPSPHQSPFPITQVLVLTFLVMQTPSPKPTKTQEKPSSRRITYTSVFSVSSPSHHQHIVTLHSLVATPPVEISLLTRSTH